MTKRAQNDAFLKLAAVAFREAVLYHADANLQNPLRVPE
jgi:hypothetical protein